ncbi:hypothetical protein P3X46_022016 [Hevea brasiliensis]|uniref:Retrotransposon Copia-like N-terminal domain-containing protein n=1 Tax=Hevea brasiliensis TaxID=3981 RepID=A0ABQ9LIP8_HEVBR|nr:hypothetical protein P3X46_022016 [Hevea brasiliensis]
MLFLFDDANSPSYSVSVMPIVPYAKPFFDISKFEVFAGHNFKRWQEQIYSILNVHDAAAALIDPKPIWEMTKEKDNKMRINEYHKLLEDLRAEKIMLFKSDMIVLTKNSVFEDKGYCNQGLFCTQCFSNNE